MIINNLENLSFSELLTASNASGSSGSQCSLIGIADNARFPIPSNCSIESLDSIPASRLSVSSSAFRGRQILPNFYSTKIVSVSLDMGKLSKYRYPKDLFASICDSLGNRSEPLPIPSALIVDPRQAFVLWAVDEPFLFSDLSDLYLAERELSKALSIYGASNKLASASRCFPVPRKSAQPLPIALVGNGAIKSRIKERLIRSTRGSGSLSLSEAESITQNCEVLSELGSLFFCRSIAVSQYPELNWIWIAAYAAAASTFVDILEAGEIARSVAESVTNNRWQEIKKWPMQFIALSYESYIEIVLRNLKAGQIKIGGDYYQIADEHWVRKVATVLKVTKEEIDGQQLRYLRPLGSEHRPIYRQLTRQMPILGSADLNWELQSQIAA